MRKTRSGRGQSTAEYAVLFAIVIGAAIAMQQYVKGRLQGAVAGVADAYSNNAQQMGGYGAFDDPARQTFSNSASDLTMTAANAGVVNLVSNSISTVNKQ